ncbi:NADH:flavin oxidoreductase/NADH oxidase [Flavobacterium sp. MFBS3-15]|uniref:NADH:flavin oxidoreductase/NADH oxidase n=1 Tax=Flavobacterium sp. MFBS3-15 TaxID=2989816 RepID=UPI0022364471|nr:NADH:flavin oxidoreductase/NADH oxidase [Flavobacterium sp. MFBS3-15]MCW4470345.1 NADH:flavin oxidoreductase/NADH oxidase [Flavobacterium sp. MFBS3-15]
MAPSLFSLLQIKSIILKNRIVISPMCQYSAEDGFANDWHLVHLGARAIGGAGLIIQEATAVSPEGRISPQDLGIWSDGHVEKYKQITAFILSQNAFPGIQLAHAGRKASITAPWQGNRKLTLDENGWRTVAPSPIPYHENEALPPVEMDAEAIRKVIADFKAATKRALEAGYKVLEIHGAHGYLLHQFLSPLINKRTDEYGGSFENRTRLLLEVVDAVNTEWPNDLPLFVRVSGTDWADGGWNEDETVALAKLLKDKGVDIIDCSSGGAVSYQKIPVGPNYQVPIAERVKREAQICTGAVGLITDAQQAEDIIKEGKADLVFFAREALRDPNIALTFAHELHADVIWPKQYERAQLED